MVQGNWWKWALSLGLPLIVFFTVPEMEIASPKTPLFLAITLWAVIAWAVEILPSAIVAAILTFLYALFVTKPAVAFSSWCTFLPWMCFSALIIAQVLNRTGLGKRIALHSMILMGSSFTKTMIGLMGAGIILTLLVPSGLARTVIFVAIAQGLIQALNVDTRSRMSSALIMGGYLAAIAPGLFCITGTEMNLLALQVVTNTTGVPVEYVDFIIQMAPFSIFYMACSIMMVFIIRGKERLQNEESLKTVLEERLKEMGPAGLVRHALDKIGYTWGEGTYYLPHKLAMGPTQPHSFWAEIFFEGRAHFSLFLRYANGLMLCMLLYLLAGALQKQSRDVLFAARLSVCGLFFFLLIWEARSRYLVNYVPVLLLLFAAAAWGMAGRLPGRGCKQRGTGGESMPG